MVIIVPITGSTHCMSLTVHTAGLWWQEESLLMAAVASPPSLHSHSLHRIGGSQTLPGISVMWCCGLTCWYMVRPGGRLVGTMTVVQHYNNRSKEELPFSWRKKVSSFLPYHKKELEGSEGVFCHSWLDVMLQIDRHKGLSQAALSTCVCSPVSTHFKYWSLNFHVHVWQMKSPVLIQWNLRHLSFHITRSP